MKTEKTPERVCARCGQTFRGYPAVSRKNPKQLICSDCGVREALESIGVEPEEQEKILKTIKKARH